MSAQHTPTLSRMASVAFALERIGWILTNVEIDVPSESARIELKRGDLRVVFDCRRGRSTIERERWRVEAERVGRKSDRFVAETRRPEFIGRIKLRGMRAGLRALAHYVADNAARSLTHAEGRDMFRPLLSVSGAALAKAGAA